MKKYSIHISIMALALALIALSCSLYQNSSREWDSVMFAVAMLSTLVVVLIGWNIYTVFDSNSRINRLKRYVEDIRGDSDQTINTLQMQNCMSLADFYRKINVVHEYFIHSLLVVKHALNNGNLNIANMYIDDMNKQFPVATSISNFHKAQVLRQLFEMKTIDDVRFLKGFDLLFNNINVNLHSE